MTTFFSQTIIRKTSIFLVSFTLMMGMPPLIFAESQISSDPGVLSQGAYVGGELGYDYATINDHFTFPFTTSHGPSELEGHTHFSAAGFVGGGFIGYGVQLKKNFYLGAEFLANGSTLSTYNQTIYNHFHDAGKYDGDGYDHTLSIKNNIGISLLPGIHLNQNVLFYGRLGYSSAHVTGTEGVIFYSEPLNLPQSTTSYSFSVSPNGFSYGLGIEAALVRHFSFRGEFIRTDYQSFKTRLNNQISVSNNQVMLGLLYHFT